MRCRKVRCTVKIAMLAVLSTVLLLTAGCWSNIDLAEINMVTALGIDRSEDGNVVVTVQIVEPSAIQSVSSGKGKSGETQIKPVFAESYQGETVADALRRMLATVDKKLFLSTTQVLILGERLCENGIDEAVDYLQRDHEIEYDTIDVLVAKDTTPKDLLEMENNMDPIPAVYIKGTIENTDSRSKVRRTTMIDLIKDMGDSGRQLVLGGISKAGEKEVKTEGAAAFKGEKLVGWLDPYETRGYLFATGQAKSAVVNISADNGKVSMEVMRSSGKIDVEFKNGEPCALTVRVDLEANVGEFEGKGKLDSPDDLLKLEEPFNEEIRREIGMALNKAQKEYSSDIFGFGTQVHRFHPHYWKKAKDNWDDIFSKLPTDIKVDAKIKQTGVIKSPVKKD